MTVNSMRIIKNEVDRNLRVREIENEKYEEEKAFEEAKKNSNFTQVYKQGWNRINFLINNNPNALKIYSFLAENIDANCGAVVVTQGFLAKALKCSDRTIRNHIKYLENNFCLVTIPLAIGGVNAYALNPEEVWKGYNNSKEYAAFNAKTLTNKKGEITRKLKIMAAHSSNEFATLTKNIS